MVLLEPGNHAAGISGARLEGGEQHVFFVAQVLLDGPAQLTEPLRRGLKGAPLREVLDVGQGVVDPAVFFFEESGNHCDQARSKPMPSGCV